ncbi:type I polyketide synthase [Actinoalloteichus caeruleus]|uniref:type I polyketide synthase n=3 Tax=Actinoalloteichus cyanogriseus TaxID=2893586 RepID=UPI0005BE7F43|nr:type I polyketide synthase [Actinoalloteichus caeruleus]
MSSSEPVAVIGMACRFAGDVDSPEAFWDLLSTGGVTVDDIPEDRWESYAARGPDHAAAVRRAPGRGAFLRDVRGFDADFFGITPREAAQMDPQQRLVLEVSWEALEHAGIPPTDLAGTDTGVYVGVGSDDYGRRLLEDLPRIEAWTGIGTAHCGVANRVSHALDLRGPSMAVDTACSSSLVSLHLAVQALRAGECPVALAGGVLVITSPGLSLVLDAAGATAADGRCKTFDADADGYGRGEGAGMVVLRRLSDARRDGDRVLAVIRGSAVRQDGRTSGIMAPDGTAQARLMRRACENAGVDPSEVDYVEAHGTGTPTGDPVEAGAMASVFGRGRPPERPLLTGSVKPNIGHLEAGAGIAGVLKAVLALRHELIPPTVNLTRPNPAVAWADSGLRVVTEPTPWPRSDRPRLAGVSGYGYGGTIAHVVLAEADPPDQRRPEDPGGADPSGHGLVPTAPPALHPVSAGSAAAVRRHAGRLADRLAGVGSPLGDLGHTLARRRSHLTHRAAVVARDGAELARGLREVAEADADALVGSVLPGSALGAVWVFSGHGSQWTGMGRELLTGSPEFAATIDRIAPLFEAELGLSPRAALLGDLPRSADVVQPLIFAVQAGLAAVWSSLGLRPAAVLGHSVGEIAAAVTAGVLTLEQGARLVARRSALLRRVAGHGGMAMIRLPAEETERRLADHPDVVVAVEASPSSTVISGPAGAVAEVCARWRDQGVAVRRVDADVAFHGPAMDPLLDPLREGLSDLAPGAAALPVYGTADPDPRSAAIRDADYWALNLRGRVRFASAVAAAVEDGHRLFLEVSPHPVVEHSLRETLEHLGIDDAFVTHSLRRGRPEREALSRGLGALYCHGADVDWTRHWPGGALVDLPTTPWDRRPHWVAEHRRPSTFGAGHDPARHTLLGSRLRLTDGSGAQVWVTRLDRESRPFPGEHPVRGVEIVPAAVLLCTLLAAAGSRDDSHRIADVALRTPVSLSAPRDVQVTLRDGALQISARLDEDDVDDRGWVTHTTARLPAEDDDGRAAPEGADPRVPAGDDLPELPTSWVVEVLAERGVGGMGFPWAVERLRGGPSRVEATVVADPGAAPHSWAPLLDAALSTASAVFPGSRSLRMPAHIRRVWLAPRPPGEAVVRVEVTDEDTVEVLIGDRERRLVGRIAGLRYGVLDGDIAASHDPGALLHEVAWRPRGLPSAPAGRLPGLAVLVGPDSPTRRAVGTAFDAAGLPHVVVADADGLDAAEGAEDVAVVVVPGEHGADGAGPAEATSAATWLLADTARRLASAPGGNGARLWCVTNAVREARSTASLVQGALWGLGRVVGGEHPELWGGVIDLADPVRDAGTVVDVLRAGPGEDVVAVRDGAQEVPRMRELAGVPTGREPTFRPEGTYLVTGGLGALGLEVARWMAGRGARRIVLAGRRGLPPRGTWDSLSDPDERGRVEAVRALERRGVAVVVVAVDLADRDASARLLDPSALGLPPIRGVVHAAGVLDDRVVRELDASSLRAVLRPKVDGAWVLHDLFPPGTVDFLVLFSSCGHLLGLPGQAAYGAANAFLDAVAAHRRSRGDLAALSLSWTSWRGLGMARSTGVIAEELAARGTREITATEAFPAWELAARHERAQVAVLRTVPLGPGDRRPPLFSELGVDHAADQAGEGAGASSPSAREALGSHASLVEEISRQVAEETRLPADDVDPRRPLVEMGVDSVMTVRIRRALERRFGLSLPTTLFWDQPDIDSVAALLVERAGSGDDTNGEAR